jgi:uncharacterized small protein (DUF1192 family)
VLTEDDNPKSSSAVHKNLDPRSAAGALESASVGELQEYIRMLAAEIQRAQAEMMKKDAGRAAAEALFGKK